MSALEDLLEKLDAEIMDSDFDALLVLPYVERWARVCRERLTSSVSASQYRAEQDAQEQYESE